MPEAEAWKTRLASLIRKGLQDGATENPEVFLFVHGPRFIANVAGLALSGALGRDQAYTLAVDGTVNGRDTDAEMQEALGCELSYIDRLVSAHQAGLSASQIIQRLEQGLI